MNSCVKGCRQFVCTGGDPVNELGANAGGHHPKTQILLFTTKVSVGAGNLKIGKLTN